MRDFLTFRRMLTPVLIQIGFWIATAIFVAAGLALIVGSGNEALRRLTFPVEPALWGVMLLVLGPVLVRIWAEFTIVIFGIHSSLRQIQHDLRRPDPALRPTGKEERDAASGQA